MERNVWIDLDDHERDKMFSQCEKKKMAKKKEMKMKTIGKMRGYVKHASDGKA